MARFTNIGLPRKTFVASAAEESRTPAGGDDAALAGGPSRDSGWGKRKGSEAGGRDPEIAKRAKMAEQKTEDRRMARIHDRVAATTCFACRGVGHAARDCPNILLAASGESGSAALLEADAMAARQAEAVAKGETDGAAEGDAEEGDGKKGKKGKKDKKGKKGKEVTGGQIVGNRCYRCNSDRHSLHHCPKPVDPADPTPYATCYICLGAGHLSSACPQNKRGIYVNGGSCKLCQSVAHRAKDCPTLHRDVGPGQQSWDARAPAADVVGTGRGAGADEDDFMALSRAGPGARSNKRHAPAKNAQRGLAKQAGEEGAYEAPAKEEVVKKAVPKKKAKVVAF